MINLENLAQKAQIKKEFIYNCAHYLRDKELIKGKIFYAPENSNHILEITITSKGIDLVESNK